MPSGIYNLNQYNLAKSNGEIAGTTPTDVEYLIVAGGGGAGSANTGNAGGGGGAGGLLTGSVGITPGTQLWVTVGAGGTGASAGGTNSTNGGNSVFMANSSGATLGRVVAIGGGYGGNGYNGTITSNSGGSGGGGGAAGTTAGAPGTLGQGNAGGIGKNANNYNGGGGGGAGTDGRDAAPDRGAEGGIGAATDIGGARTAYAGGGGGGGYNASVGGLGGAGGGGNGGSNTTGSNGTANTGGGGGGAGGTASGGSGGSGIVIISYPDTYQAASATTGSPTVTTSGSGSVYFYSQAVYTNSANSGLAVGTGDFTAEIFAYLTNATFCGLFCSAYNGGGADGFAIANTTAWVGDNTTGTTIDLNSGSSIPINQWNHVAICRESGTTRVYLNGTLAGTSGAYAATSMTSGLISIGQLYPNQANQYTVTNTAYFTNARFVNTALYTGASFTVPTAPLLEVSGTQFLASMVSGATLNNSSNKNFLLANGNSWSWHANSPFATGFGYKNRVYKWTSSGSITF